MDYAFLVSPKTNPLRAGFVDQYLKPLYPQIRASTVAQHTVPWLVILHTEGELSPQEMDDIQSILDNLDPPKEELTRWPPMRWPQP